jgi:hypothetical protein
MKQQHELHDDGKLDYRKIRSFQQYGHWLLQRPLIRLRLMLAAQHTFSGTLPVEWRPCMRPTSYITAATACITFCEERARLHPEEHRVVMMNAFAFTRIHARLVLVFPEITCAASQVWIAIPTTLCIARRLHVIRHLRIERLEAYSFKNTSKHVVRRDA